MPTWIWYAIGAGVFIVVFLYFQSSKNQSASPVGGTVTVPNTADLANYNGSADILTNILAMQQPVISHLAAGNGSSTASK